MTAAILPTLCIDPKTNLTNDTQEKYSNCNKGINHAKIGKKETEERDGKTSNAHFFFCKEQRGKQAKTTKGALK